MTNNIFNEMSQQELQFFEELSNYSLIKRREQLNSTNKLRKKDKINFIYENKLYLNSEDRFKMNKLVTNPMEKFKTNLRVFGFSFIGFGIFNVLTLELAK
jgi:hypothetical protein